MRYRGSKNRIAKKILPIMLEHKKQQMVWVEPFVGGANMIDKVSGPRIGADMDEYLIEALTLIRDSPEKIPDVITEKTYQKLKQEMRVDGLTGFAGFSMSFGGRFFEGYARDVAGTRGCLENMKTQSRRAKNNAIKQSKNLQGVEFRNCSYEDLTLDMGCCLIYCDPPYAGTKKYRCEIDHTRFWRWCLEMSSRGHVVFISEYSAPADFACVWEGSVNTTLGTSAPQKNTERLFIAPQ